MWIDTRKRGDLAGLDAGESEADDRLPVLLLVRNSLMGLWTVLFLGDFLGEGDDEDDVCIELLALFSARALPRDLVDPFLQREMDRTQTN